ncbi:urease accessory protein UreF [Pseudooceanicola nanhaiensis]|uniref:urease accessory protein UreF n=1 Tax=Pseudooceanicola nanhaiensis TaxID=375761 RepID=UPI001CD3DE52|nr:urease accessory UreF family protein [Pseudooceanicola nanhaiensis]MCA0922103.1 urease accessory protein UreF [Pseudooceanicola nanhaiensis]
MTTDAAMLLHQWLSPAFPVGAFAYSHGLEYAVHAGEVSDRATLEGWLETALRLGAGRSDAILLAHGYRADPAELAEIAELAAALAPSAERLLETEQQGRAFAETVNALYGYDLPPMPYPVALGAAAARQGLPLADTLRLYLQAFAANLASAAVRLVPLGQTDGQRAVMALLPTCAALAAEAETAPLDEIGSCALSIDIAAMRHETQATRLFRS